MEKLGDDNEAETPQWGAYGLVSLVPLVDCSSPGAAALLTA